MYYLEEKYKGLRSQLRAFVDEEILPVAGKLDKAAAFPKELYKEIGARGYLNAEFAIQHTNAKYNAVEGTVILEEISRGMASVALIMAPHYQCCEIMAQYGTDELKKLVEPARKGEYLFALALTEERGGSDALGVDAIAVKKGDKWILNGKKCYITNAGIADGYIITAKSPSAIRSRSISLFYIPSDTKGLMVKESNMLGLRNSPMGEIIMDNCSLPEYCLIGRESESYPVIKPVLNEGRLHMSAVAVGIAQRALEVAAQRANKSGQYGKSLSSYQSISFYLAEMYTKILMARNSLYSVAKLMLEEQPHTRDVAALKYFSTEACCEITRMARQIHGAYGLTLDSEVDRLYRDAEMITIAEGTSEICKIIISSGINKIL